MDILFLEPLFKERIWGGQRLNAFGYTLPFDKTGECWAISAHPHGESIVQNGRFKGRPLSHIFENHKELFNHIPFDRFPLLTKILDANDDLSVQVHPNDEYALSFGNDLGKTECWYVLEAADDAHIIYGHRAVSETMFIKMIKENRWHELLIKKQVNKGDFFYVPAGTVHALGKGILILETQQSSDTTYRLYDYNRKDEQGNQRDLHIEKSIEVSNIPHMDPVLEQHNRSVGSALITQYVSSTFFTVEKWMIKDTLHITNGHFKCVSVIDGAGSINGESIKKGDHFIICANVESIQIDGTLDVIVSWV